MVILIDLNFLRAVVLHRWYRIARLTFIQKSIIAIKLFILSVRKWARDNLSKDAPKAKDIYSFAVVLICYYHLWSAVPAGHYCGWLVSLTAFPIFFWIYENLSDVIFQRLKVCFTLLWRKGFYELVISRLLDVVYCPICVGFIFHRPWKTEITNFHMTAWIYQEICRFQISVNYVGWVKKIQGTNLIV